MSLHPEPSGADQEHSLRTSTLGVDQSFITQQSSDEKRDDSDDEEHPELTLRHFVDFAGHYFEYRRLGASPEQAREGAEDLLELHLDNERERAARDPVFAVRFMDAVRRSRVENARIAPEIAEEEARREARIKRDVARELARLKRIEAKLMVEITVDVLREHQADLRARRNPGVSGFAH